MVRTARDSSLPPAEVKSEHLTVLGSSNLIAAHTSLIVNMQLLAWGRGSTASDDASSDHKRPSHNPDVEATP